LSAKSCSACARSRKSAIEVDTALTAQVVEVLTQLAQGRSLPPTIVVDNGRELII